MRIRSSLARTIMDGVYDGVYIMDRDRKIHFWNRAAERITGFAANEAVGIRCRDNLLIHVDADGTFLCTEELCPAHRSMQDGREREAEVYLHHKAGHRVAITTKICPIRDKKGKIIGAVEVFTDNRSVRELTDRMEELEKLALLDQLTQIGNRRYAEFQLRHALNEMQRYGWPFAVFFLDLDKFKRVNDTYGHATGDLVLQIAARTLSSTLRSSDVVCRWGGEEFVVIVRNPKGRLQEIGNRMRFLVARSGIQTPNGTLTLTVSIGATFAKSGDTPEDLIFRSDQLMYQSKKAGGDVVSIDN